MGRNRIRVTVRQALRAGLAAAALLLPAQGNAQNIILLIADDVGVDGVVAYGEQPKAGPTPNIDALAAQGVLFRNAWANPSCSPTRASILTGLNPARHGLGWPINPNDPDAAAGLDPNILTFSKLLGSAGYRTVALGKYHMAGDPQSWNRPLLAGFDYFAGYIWGGADYYDWPKTVNGKAPDGTVVPATTTETTTYATIDTANDTLAELGRNEPYFLWVAFMAAHSPLHVPPPQLQTYDLDGVPISGNEPMFHKAIVQAMDTEIGRIMAAVDFSKTTVIFIGDNGTPDLSTESPFIPQHAKFSLYEGAVNVPLIIAGQAVAPAARGKECVALVQATDLFATILELAGAPDRTRDSVSLAPYLTTPTMSSIRPWTYAEEFKPNGGPVDPQRYYRTARDTRYKIQREATYPDRFYDLLADPWELQPLDLSNLTPEQQASYRALDLVIRAQASTLVPGPGVLARYVTAAAIVASALAFLRRGRLRRHRGSDTGPA